MVSRESPHTQIITRLSFATSKVVVMSKPTVIDLFAGCGGMTDGFVRAGFDPIAAVEFDLAAAATYAANFGEDHVHRCDIADWRDGIPEADVVIGGPPCQGFSNLGTRDATDPRNKLWREYARVVMAAQPKVFVIENVDRFAASPEFGLLQNKVRYGSLRGYKLTHAVLNAADYGVPQRRRRTIVIGSRIGDISFPEPTHLRRYKANRGWRTVESALRNVDPDVTATKLPVHEFEFEDQIVPGPFPSRSLHIGRNPELRSLERYRSIPAGGGRFDIHPKSLLPPCWRKKAKGTTDVMGRMHWDQPSLTIRTEFFKPEKGRYLHPERDRAITHFEASLLQTFPRRFKWCGSKSQIASQIGNAVPPDLALVIARHIFRHLGH